MPQHASIRSRRSTSRSSRGSGRGTANLVLALAFTGLGTVTVWSLLGALAVGSFGYGASITLWVRGAQQLGAARAQVIFASAPFLGAILAWLVLTDPVEPVQIVAMVIALCGVALSLRSSHVHRHEHDQLMHVHEHDHVDVHHAHTHDEVIERRHSHVHEHRALVHAHPHVPDLHHRHEH